MTWRHDFQPLCWNHFLQPAWCTAGQQSSPSVAAAMREGKHLQRSRFSLAGPCTCVSSGPEPQRKAHTSYPVKTEQKSFKVYFANSPSELWLLTSALFFSQRPSQLPWDFHFHLRLLKLESWLRFIRPVSIWGLHCSAKPCDPTYTCLQPSSCSQAPHST